MNTKYNTLNVLSRRRGALTVEVALIMPIFALFLAAIMEFGHYCLVVNTLQAAARRGAHLGSFEGTSTSDVEARVRQIAGAAIDPRYVTVNVRDASVFDSPGFNAATTNYSALPPMTLSNAERGDCFLVQVRVPYDNVALLPPFWLKNKSIEARAAMRHE